jgi:hypothetical protein
MFSKRAFKYKINLEYREMQNSTTRIETILEKYVIEFYINDV